VFFFGWRDFLTAEWVFGNCANTKKKLFKLAYLGESIWNPLAGYTRY